MLILEVARGKRIRCGVVALAALVAFAQSATAQQTYLIGVTGDGASTPESLFLIDPSDASASLLMALGAGTDGEVIGWNPDDGLLYHTSGNGPGNRFWESLDPVRRTIETSVELTGDGTGENSAMVHDPSTGNFLVGERVGSPFYEVTPAGVSSVIGTLPEAMKGLAFVGSTLYGAAAFTPTLFELDPADGSMISSTAVTLGGNPVTGMNGLATHPETGALWGVFRNGSSRTLGTIDPDTGVVTSVGTLPEKFAGLAFVPEPSLLLGVTGDGASVPETLYALDESDAAASLLMTLGNGGGGEAIALHVADRLLYHVSGNSNGNRVWESIDVMRRSVESSGGTSGVSGEPNAIVYRQAIAEFLMGNTGQTFYEVTPAGVGTAVGALPESIQGLAFSGGKLYGAASSSATLYVLDREDGSMISSTAVTLGGSPITGTSGLAAHPWTGALWGVFRQGGSRSLGTVDPGTGVVTAVGTLGDDFESLAFLPEPTPAAALASGVLLIGLLARARRRD